MKKDKFDLTRRLLSNPKEKNNKIEFIQCFVLGVVACVSCKIMVAPKSLTVAKDATEFLPIAEAMHAQAVQSNHALCFKNESLIISYSLGITTDRVLNPVLKGH